MLEFAQIAIGGLVVGSIYAAIALGFSLVYRVTGAINLSQGGFALVSAMIGYTFAVAWGWPLVFAIPAAVITTVIAGVVLARFTFVPALARLSNANVLMLTAGILTMIEGFSLAVWGSQPYATPPFSGERPLAFGAVLIPTQAFWVFGATALSIAALWFLIAKTKLGKALRACAENPSAASLMGIDVPRMTLLSFGLATLIAAVSGVIVAPTTSLQFDTGPPVYDFRLRRSGDRRHRVVSRRGNRWAFSRPRDAILDCLHLFAVFERDLAAHSAWSC